MYATIPQLDQATSGCLSWDMPTLFFFFVSVAELDSFHMSQDVPGLLTGEGGRKLAGMDLTRSFCSASMKGSFKCSEEREQKTEITQPPCQKVAHRVHARNVEKCLINTSTFQMDPWRWAQLSECTTDISDEKPAPAWMPAPSNTPCGTRRHRQIIPDTSCTLLNDVGFTSNQVRRWRKKAQYFAAHCQQIMKCTCEASLWKVLYKENIYRTECKLICVFKRIPVEHALFNRPDHYIHWAVLSSLYCLVSYFRSFFASCIMKNVLSIKW